jgi:kinesin family protein 5
VYVCSLTSNAVVPETAYNFDKVLGPQSVQADIYEAAVAPVIADVMNGYNGTIMAYGQTGAGKTHTLSSIEPNNIGMMPRAAAEIFVQANNDPAHEYVVLMSYVQIYMELIQDLLRPESENLVRSLHSLTLSPIFLNCIILDACSLTPHLIIFSIPAMHSTL